MPKARNKIFRVSICCIYLFKEFKLITYEPIVAFI